MTHRAAEPVLFCWSGGKDSCMALHQLRRDPLREVVERQAAALGLSLEIVTIPPGCVNTEYESRMEKILSLWKNRGVTEVAFGDIFLQDLREYREKNLARIGMRALFPVC